MIFLYEGGGGGATNGSIREVLVGKFHHVAKQYQEILLKYF